MRGTTIKVAAGITIVAALTLVACSPADARGWHRKHWHRPPAATAPASPVPRPTPTAEPTPTDGPDDDAAFSETFNTDAPAGQFASTYADAWQPYPDGTGSKYYSAQVISAHDGVMDVSLDGRRGAAGTFGTMAGAWDHIGGTFSIRAKATGGDGNGAAIMLWPTSNVWADGELDYPEGNFDSTPMVFHHSMVRGQEATAQAISTNMDWRDWHTYTTDWEPGQYVRYYLDGDLIGTITTNVPTTPHRYMFQVGNWGNTGHLLIDWVSTDD